MRGARVLLVEKGQQVAWMGQVRRVGPLDLDGQQALALFMQLVNANVAEEAGRLHLWRERLWSRR